MSIDLNFLDKKLAKKTEYKYEDVKHQLVKVAWDIVQFKPSEEDIDGLWQIKKTPSGEVIVAMYSDEGLVAESSVKTASVKGHWNVVKSASNDIHIFYKDTFVTKFASSDTGLASSEIDAFCGSVKDSLASDKEVVNKVTSALSDYDRKELIKKHPELA